MTTLVPKNIARLDASISKLERLLSLPQTKEAVRRLRRILQNKRFVKGHLSATAHWIRNKPGWQIPVRVLPNGHYHWMNRAERRRLRRAKP